MRAHQPGSIPIDIPETESRLYSRTRARTGAGADQADRKSNRPQKGVECSAVRVAYLVDPADAMVACLIAGASVAVSAAP